MWKGAGGPEWKGAGVEELRPDCKAARVGGVENPTAKIPRISEELLASLVWLADRMTSTPPCFS
jgi:hypothetical protein